MAATSTLLTVALVAAAPAQQPEVLRLDLPQALAWAMEHNHQLAFGALEPRAARLGLASAEAELGFHIVPEITADRDDGRESGAWGVDVSRRLAAGTQVRARVRQVGSSGDVPTHEAWSVEVTQPLLRRFGPLVHRDPVVTARRAVDAADRRHVEAQADLVLAVVTAYELVLRSRRQVEADELALRRSEQLARWTEAQARLGRATRIDTLRGELQVGQLLTRQQLGVERLELAQQDLAVLLGIDRLVLFELEPAPRLELEVPELEQAVEIALEHRLDIAQVLDDAADAERQVRLARRGLLPDVAAAVRYEAEQGLGSAWDGGRVSAGVRLSGELFDPEARVAVGRAVLGQAAEEQRVRIAVQQAATTVRRAWLALRRSRAEVPMLEKNIEHARARRELATRLFRAGRGDNFSVVDAEESFVAAEAELLDGLAAASIDAYRLLRELGTLVEAPEHLGPAAASEPRR